MDSSGGVRVLSRAKQKDFRSASHNLLLKRDDIYNLRLNATEKNKRRLYLLYEEALSSSHAHLFLRLDKRLTSVISSSSSSPSPSCHSFQMVVISTGLSDMDRGELVKHYFEKHLPFTKATFNSFKNESSLLSRLIVVESHCTALGTAEECITELLNSLIRQQRQLDATCSVKSCIKPRQLAERAIKSREQLRCFWEHLSPAEKLREVFDTIVGDKVFQYDLPAPPPFVVVFKQSERLDRHVLSEISQQLNGAFKEVNIVLLAFQATSCALPFPLVGAAQQIVSLEIINSPSPLQVFDNFVSSLVSSVYFLPFIVPLNMVQWLSDCFRELDHCVWAAMSRTAAVMMRHFQRRQGLLCMYSNPSFAKEIRNGPKLAVKLGSKQCQDASRRLKVLQWLLNYMDTRDTDSSTREVLFDASSINIERKDCANLSFAETAACNMDYRVFRNSLDGLTFRLLKSIRNKFVRRSERECFASDLIWEGVLKQSSYANSSNALSPNIVSDLIEIMQSGLLNMSMQTVLKVFKSWGELFALLDSSYASGFPLEKGVSSNLTLPMVEGVEAICSKVRDCREKHGELVLLLEEFMGILKHRTDLSNGHGSDAVPSNMSYEELRSLHSVVLSNVEIESIHDGQYETTVVETDILSLLHNLLNDIHSWMSNTILTILSSPRPPPLEGILTLAFDWPTSLKSNSSESGWSTGNHAVHELHMCLRSDTLLTLMDDKFQPFSTMTTVQNWLPDTTVLYRRIVAVDRKEFSLVQLFDEFCKGCSCPHIDSTKEKTKSSLPATGSKRKRSSGVKASSEVDEDAERADEEMKHLQCRFIVAVNDLQRLGCVRMMGSGEQLKRLLA